MSENSLALVKFGEEEIKLIKSSKCPDSTDAEFKLFVYDCQSRGLNPLKNEIHFIKRNSYNPKTGKSEGRATHQVGIDGFRIIAQRSGEYRGQTKVEFGEVMNFMGQKVPEYAEVGVYRQGFEGAVYGRAYFSEYAQVFKDKMGSMWAKMPRGQIAKCAEALALRRAFPDCLAGLYTPDEMGQAENTIDAPKKEKASVKVVEKKEPEKIPELSEKEKAEIIEDFNFAFADYAKLMGWTDSVKVENESKLLKGAVPEFVEPELLKKYTAQVKARTAERLKEKDQEFLPDLN